MADRIPTPTARKKKRTTIHSPIARKDVLRRIARLQGQIRALERTIEEGDDWGKIFMFAATVEGAADQIIADLFQRYLESLAQGRAVSEEERGRYMDFRRKLNIVMRRF